MNIKPGDLFEWVYTHNFHSIREPKEMFSYSMKQFVPCGGWCLCVAVHDDMIHWFSLSTQGLLHAYCTSHDQSNGLWFGGYTAMPSLISL